MTAPVRRAGADLRLLRAAVFTAVCVALSAGGHVLASGGTVPLWTLGAASLFVLSIAFAAAGRERSLPAIGALLAVGQLGLHSLFGLGQHTAGTRPSSLVAFARDKLLCGLGGAPLTEGRARQLILDAGIDPDRTDLAAGLTGHGAHSAHTAQAGHEAVAASAYSLPMLLGHLLAALAAGWLLRRGEAALFRLVKLAAPAHSLRSALRLAAALRDGLQYAVEPRRDPTRIDCSDGAPPSDPSVVLAHSVIRRGPPAFGLAA